MCLHSGKLDVIFCRQFIFKEITLCNPVLGLPHCFHHCLCKIICCLVAKSCPTLCYPIGRGPPGSSVPGTSQARIPSELPFPPPKALPYPSTEPASLALAGRFFTAEPSQEPWWKVCLGFKITSIIKMGKVILLRTISPSMTFASGIKY